MYIAFWEVFNEHWISLREQQNPGSTASFGNPFSKGNKESPGSNYRKYPCNLSFK